MFLGFSILLGRIYFLSRIDSLGIPESAIRLNVVDYAIISPEVTLFGILLSILAPLSFLLTRALSAISFYPWRSAPIIWPILQILLALVFLIFSTIASNSVPLEFSEGCGCNVWQFLIPFFLPTFLALGSAFAINGTSQLHLLLNGDDNNSKLDTEAFTRVVTGVVLILVLTVSLFMSIHLSDLFGEANGRTTLNGAPQAFIEVKSDERDEILNSSDNCLKVGERCIFRIILIGDDFIYVRPTPLNSSHFGSTIFSVPKSDILQITYIP